MASSIRYFHDSKEYDFIKQSTTKTNYTYKL